MQIGNTFGSLVFIKELAKGRGLFFCKRSAVYKDIAKPDVKRGRIISCGCFGKEQRKSLHTTHNQSNSPTHNSWKSMLQRSRHPKQHGYSYKITVHPEWDPQQGGTFQNFLSDMGERPSGMSLDRFPNRRGGYSPENCRWATEKQQIENRDLTPLHGELQPNAKLTEEDVLKIRELNKSGMPTKGIAKIFPVSKSLINRIIRRVRWAHI